MFLIETKNWGGRIIGDAQAPSWTQIRNDGGRPRKLGNPIQQGQRHSAVLRDCLAAARIDWPDVSRVVVFASKGSEIEVTGADTPLLHVQDLAEFISNFSGTRTYAEPEIDKILNLVMKGL